jgi:hypothetical protein
LIIVTPTSTVLPPNGMAHRREPQAKRPVEPVLGVRLLDCNYSVCETARLIFHHIIRKAKTYER